MHFYCDANLIWTIGKMKNWWTATNEILVSLETILSSSSMHSDIEIIYHRFEGIQRLIHSIYVLSTAINSSSMKCLFWAVKKSEYD